MIVHVVPAWEKESRTRSSRRPTISMQRKVGLDSLMLWTLFLISSSATLSDGGKNKGSSMKDVHMHDKGAIFETFEVDGHVIDCIDIYKQPAFEHPLLINHTIQMKPTNYVEKTRIRDHELAQPSYPWKLPKSCPNGSIPMRRVQRSRQYDGLRQKGMQNPNGFDSRNYEGAGIFSQGVDLYKLHGVRASLNVWNPKVQIDSELSSSIIWLSDEEKKTYIQAGWLVFPHLNGDDKTRFFIRWAISGYDALCYNLMCPGFVHTNPRTNIDTRLEPVSLYGGQQYEVEVEISKDQQSGNWWVHLQGAPMGYWPKKLVAPSLDFGARYAVVAGEIYNSKPGGQHTSTQMGSGHFAPEGFRNASFFKNIELAGADSQFATPGAHDVQAYTNRPECYNLHPPDRKSTQWGMYFYYGGPGKSAQCT